MPSPAKFPTSRILIFGASGSAGGSVLSTCISSAVVAYVTAVVRRPLNRASPKLKVYLHKDYLDYAPAVEAFRNIDACFFLLGASATGVSGEGEYRRINQEYPLAAAAMLKQESPRAAFHYVSGTGTSAKSWFMWSRVKAETETRLIKLTGAVCWRPAAIDGQRSPSSPRLYQTLRPMMALMKPFRGLYVSGSDFGRAMLYATAQGLRGRIVENREIRDFADRADF